MSVRHCVLGAFTAEATEEQKRAMLDNVRSMPEKIKEIKQIVCGLDLGLAEGNHDFAITVDFACEDDYQIYATHAAHKEVIANYIKPILKPGSRVAVQYKL